MPVDELLKSALPIPNLASRGASAIIFGFYERRKEGIKTLLLLGKKSRAYVITQDGCRGFLLGYYCNSVSWLYGMKMLETYKTKMAQTYEGNDFDKIFEEIVEFKQAQEIDIYLKRHYRDFYLLMLTECNG